MKSIDGIHLIIDAVGVLCLSVLFWTALLTEHNRCSIRMKHWLGGEVARQWLHLYLSFLSSKAPPCSLEGIFIGSLLGGLNLAGVVWLVPMSVEFFAPKRCHQAAPLHTHCGEIYLIGYVLYYGYYGLFMLWLWVSRPCDLRDQAYLLMRPRRRYTSAPNPPSDLQSQPKVDWKAWLERHGCQQSVWVGEGLPCPAPEQTTHAGEEAVACKQSCSYVADENGTGTKPGCSICLEAYPSRDGHTEDRAKPRDTVPVVSFPCPAGHQFHAHCLHTWLQVCHQRGKQCKSSAEEARIHCPICRERPVSGKAD